MDAPAMLTRKHVPEDVGHRNTGEVEDEGTGGQAQLQRDEKQHKPVLKKVKEKVKKIKNTLAGHGHSHDGEHGGIGGDEHMRDAGTGSGGGSSSSSEEAEEDAVEREAALEKGGYMDDVEDNPVVMESDPEVHGAPMYESARAPAVQDLVAKYDQHQPVAQEVESDGAAPKLRLGDIGGPAVEDPAAPRSTMPAAREGEDIGTTPVVQQFETMSFSDDPAHVGAGKKGARAEEWKDKAADTVAGGGASYTDRLKNAAAGTTEYGKKLASTVYEKVAGVGTAVGVGKRDDEQRTEAVPPSNTAGVEEWRDAPEATDTDADATRGAGYADKIKSAAAGTTGYGKQVASTVYEKVAGVGTAVGVGKRDDEQRTETVPASNTAATDDTTRCAGYTDNIKSAAAGTTGYGKQLASTVYDKVAGVGSAVAPNLRPQEVSAKAEGGAHSEAMPVPDTGAEEWKDAPTATDGTNTATGPGTAGYTDKIKSAAAGTTEYGKQLASTVYEKVAGVGSAVAGKVHQATQSAGAQQDTATPGGGGQDKGVTVTGYIAEKLRPGDEDRALSEAISGAVQRRKEDVGGTVAQRVPAPSQVITKAREAVTSLTGGNRVSETVQPTTATGEDVKEGYAAEAPVIRGEPVGGTNLNTIKL